MDCRHSCHLIDAGTYVVGPRPTLSALAYVVGSRLRCRRHQFRALSLPFKGLYLLNMYICREVGGQNNAYATEEADDAGEWKNAAGEGIF